MDRGSGFQSHQPSVSDHSVRPKVGDLKTRADERWYFSSDQLRKTPSGSTTDVNSEIKDKDVWNRYQCAELVQTLGQKLKLPQFVINTAILYMHRFYQFHPMTRFHRHTMAPVFIFLAAKVDENPRRLDSVIRETHRLLYANEPPLVDTSEKYLEELQNMVTHENVLLQTLAFDLTVQHPHEKVIRCCQLIRCDKELSHAAYDLASCALHFTSLCIQYNPVLVAAMCVHVAAKWSNVKIPLSEPDKRPWWFYMDSNLNEAQIQKVTDDFLAAVEGYPPRVRTKIWNQVLGQGRTPHAGPHTGKPVGPAPPGMVSNKPGAASSITAGATAARSGDLIVAQSKLIGSSRAPPPQAAIMNAVAPRSQPTGPPPPPGPPGAQRPQAPPPPPKARAVDSQAHLVGGKRDRPENASETQRRVPPGNAFAKKEDAVEKDNVSVRREDVNVKKEAATTEAKKYDVKSYHDNRMANPIPREMSATVTNGNSLADKRPSHLHADDSNGNGSSPSTKRVKRETDPPVFPTENVMRT